jgi:integrase
VVEVQGRLEWGVPKTKAGRRTVVIPRPVAGELAAHLTTHAGAELVFPAPEGGPLRTPAWRRRFWQPATVAADLSPWDESRCTAEGKHVHSAKLGCKRDWLRPHDLRHTAVAIWIAAGANLIEVSRRAGHTSVSFTLDRYGHLFEDADQALADKLDGVFVAPTPTVIAPVTPLRADTPEI